MTQEPEEPTAADELHTTEAVPREVVWERIRNVDRDWSPDRTREEHERTRPRTVPSRVLVPFDDSEPARYALEYACELFPAAEITALTIVDDSTISYIPNPTEGSDAGPVHDLLVGMPSELERAVEIAERCDKSIRTAGRVGAPTQGIVEFLADESVDHVVIGSHSRSGIARFLLGSVAETVVRHSSVPVTVIPVRSSRDD